jgi:hypothetical protein
MYQGQECLLAHKSQGYSISLGNSEVYSYDLEGRLIWAYQSGMGYQRGLNGQILAKTRSEQGQKKRSLLSIEERIRLLQSIFALLESIFEASPQNYSSRVWLAKILKQSSPAILEKMAEDFSHVYRPVSILPPDQYASIVLQAAEGCSWNRCSFCNFYKDRKFRIKTRPQFADHISALKTFLGQGQISRPSLFLADGDALMIPQKHLLDLVSDMRQAFPGKPWYSFMDAFRPGLKSLEDYQQLAQKGLKRVYLGIETAHAPLLKLLNKPADPAIMAQEVALLKNAGLQVGLIFMTGIGGREMASEHLKTSLSWLDNLPLTKGDLIYLSEFIPHPDQPYVTLASQAGIQPLTEIELAEQVSQFRQGLAKSLAQVAPYHLLEYIY